MGNWKSGAFRMAAELKATILPVAIKGTADSWEKRKNSKTIPEVSTYILEPFDIAEQEKSGKEMEAKDLRLCMEKMIEQALEQSTH
jgi:1-acyl-sn-glycerol-3-phosphate acyltransferase